MSGRVSGEPTLAQTSEGKHVLADAREREEFFAMLAHDIRTPVGLIAGYVDMLIERARARSSSEEEDLLDRVGDSLLTLHSLTSNYLELFRCLAGAGDTRKSPVSLNVLLRRVSKLFEAHAGRRRLRVHLCLQEDLPAVAGDGVALECVFANLIHNAIKFTPAGGRITPASLRQNATVVVTVEDTGPAIPAHELPAVFEKYRTSPASSKQTGSGLGLFIAKTIVEAHEGTIDVWSRPGSGTTFIVQMPLPRRPDHARHEAARPVENLVDKV